jgi:hypothetical protein
MDALIKASEEHGFSWRVLDTGKTIVEIDGQTVEVTLVEKLSRRELPGTYRSRIEFESTGLLSFRIDQHIYGIGRKTWNDTARKKLDGRLHEILNGLPAIAAAIRTRDEERAAQRQQWEAEGARRAQIAREAEGLRRLRLRMVRHMQSWERATRLRAFVAEVERLGGAHVTRRPDLDAWLNWAKAHIELLDPILTDTDGVVSLVTEVPEHFDHSYKFGPKPVDWWQPATSEDQ